MVTWIKHTFGKGAVPWFFFCATIAVCVAGIAGTIFFGVTGITAGLGVSIPAIVVGFFGFFLTGALLDDNGYI